MVSRGVIPGGAGGATAHPTFGQQHFFVFSHTTDRKVPSEVVLMGSVMSVIYGNSAKTGIVQSKISRIMIPPPLLGLEML